jgi:long-chain acyl-CoA synthetase
MSKILSSLQQVAAISPHRIALQGAESGLSYHALQAEIATSADALRDAQPSAIGLFANNGIPWAVADLSAIAAEIPLVPIPLFFSSQQILHVIRDAGLDTLLTDRQDDMQDLLAEAGIQMRLEGEVAGLHRVRLLNIEAKVLPPGTAKITYTSGTTGTPKGVCLSLAHLETVAASLCTASLAQSTDRHLCLTPLSTLLENIAGIYVPLLARASSCVLPLQQVGLNGASGFNIKTMLQALHASGASTAILAPQMLQAMVVAIDSGAAMPVGLRFVAVGGAPVSPRLLLHAQSLGLPVYEGYGLSECASVVSLNTPANNRAHSAGRALPHVQVSFAEDGEILIQEPLFLGYLGQGQPQVPFPTGDIGYLDSRNYLHITGRKKSLFITSLGRNIAPEWLERELTLQPDIAQAAVFGEGRPFNVAILVPSTHATPTGLNKAVEITNRLLPDYARIRSWVIAESPFSTHNQQLTSNGRLKREAILAAHTHALDTLYQEISHDVF